MPARAGCESAYFFLLGLSSGLALLMMTAFRRITPGWLRGLLLASGSFVISRYLAMATFANAARPDAVWPWHYCWFATSLAIPLQTAFAMDQLIRHPGMTAKTVLLRFSPWLAAYAAIILFGRMEAAPDRVVGWSVHLAPGWQWLLAAAHATFVLAVVSLVAMVARRLPSPPIRLALWGLAASQLLLALDGILAWLGHWSFHPSLYSEAFALVALWYAYDTASRAAF